MNPLDWWNWGDDVVKVKFTDKLPEVIYIEWRSDITMVDTTSAVKSSLR